MPLPDLLQGSSIVDKDAKEIEQGIKEDKNTTLFKTEARFIAERTLKVGKETIKGDKVIQKLTVELGNTEASEKAMRQTAGLSISTSWLIGFKPMLY